MIRRYVIHRHDTMSPHYDLMLDGGTSLETYRITLDDLDRLRTSRSVMTERLDDHRREYLNYEGPVSGERGRVSLVDRGTFTEGTPEFGGRCVSLRGSLLTGTLRIYASESGELMMTLEGS